MASSSPDAWSQTQAGKNAYSGNKSNATATNEKGPFYMVKPYWGRVGYVEINIFNDNGTIETIPCEGLDFKFKITQILGRMPEGNMSVSICGLSHATANKIVTLCNTAEALKKRKTVRVYAGYRNENNPNYKGKCLATMDIINATITTPPPDIWLQITGVYAGWLNDQKICFDIADIKKKKLSQMSNWEVAKVAIGSLLESADVAAHEGDYDEYAKFFEDRQAGVTAEYLQLPHVLKIIIDRLNELSKKRGDGIEYSYKVKLSKSDQTVYKKYQTVGGFTMYDSRKPITVKGYSIPGRTRRFRYTGTLAKLPTKISETFLVNAMWENIGNKKICLKVYSDPRYSPGIDPKDLDFIGSNTVKFLSVETGLIGIPKLKDSVELQCRFLLDENITAGDYVCVNSVLMDAIHAMGQVIKTQHGEASVYQIMKITFTGHMRGNEWYCDVSARRPMDIQTFKQNAKPRAIWMTDDLEKTFETFVLNEETGEMKSKERGRKAKAIDWVEDMAKRPNDRLNTVYD